MKKVYKGKNVTISFEAHKPNKWYQWLFLGTSVLGIGYLIAQKNR
ncbi:hypothetical protein [Companilactobacillus sp. HBUAS56275]